MLGLMMDQPLLISDLIRHADVVPNDSKFATQWQYQNSGQHRNQDEPRSDRPLHPDQGSGARYKTESQKLSSGRVVVLIIHSLQKFIIA